MFLETAELWYLRPQNRNKGSLCDGGCLGRGHFWNRLIAFVMLMIAVFVSQMRSPLIFGCHKSNLGIALVAFEAIFGSDAVFLFLLTFLSFGTFIMVNFKINLLAK